MLKYDPGRNQNAREWLRLSEGTQIKLVEGYHLHARIKLPNPRLHAVIHTVVESQIAMGAETPAKETLERLKDEGLSRHEAIHAMGSVLAKYLLEADQGQGRGDAKVAYFDDLRALTAKQWKAETQG